jgi:hypothetical protein
MIHEYKALQDTLHGIKKDDIVDYDDVAKKSILRRNRKALPFDVSKESTFFQFQPPTPQSVYNVGDKIHLKIAQKLKIIKAPKNNQIGKMFEIQPFVVLQVIAVQFKTNVSPASLRRKTKQRNYEYRVSLGKNYEYILDSDESLIEKTEFYWFISSKGQVGQDIAGRDQAADTFRKKNRNYFTNSKDASLKLTTLK